MTALDEARKRYARIIAAAPGVDDERVSAAFAAVPREPFVGAGPWLFLADDGYVESESSDPALIHEDVVVALLPGKRINNGQPTLHARCLSAARVRPGERVLHIGCGSGYYTAILSELVGPEGEVCAWDVEPSLVATASASLNGRPGVHVALRDATASPIPRRDLIYACAGCTHPIRAWAEALSDGGRLLFPLTPGWDHGGMLMVTRRAGQFDAEFICRCSFIPCIGGSSPAEASVLRTALSDRSLESVSSLHFGDARGRPGVWLEGDGWWLSSARPAAVQ